MKTNTIFKVIGFVLAIAVLLFGGIGITGTAAQSAIPGDALYAVKTTIENTRLSLAQDAGDRAQMKLAFAEQRLSEISGLIREGRYREIREAVLAFEANINAAIMELESVSALDPARAAAITHDITSALTRYAQTLSELAVVAPDSIKPEVARALDTTQIASRLGQSAANENANDNGDDSGNVNTNENANDNSNDSSSDDSGDINANEDDSGNVNADDNTNVDDIANDNSGDDNSNTDDNGNDNSVDNNSNDDNSGENSSSDDNGSDDSSDKGSDSDDDGSDDNSGGGVGSDD